MYAIIPVPICLMVLHALLDAKFKGHDVPMILILLFAALLLVSVVVLALALTDLLDALFEKIFRL